ncbi:MAG: hypothetical protein KatS3mg115_0681 [Candidatus Poribacteria bacterium]|nr:MAG: hypothetical protein KatS3mg115_0681 [Candidatus Poribacteria bacterium]
MRKVATWCVSAAAAFAVAFGASAADLALYNGTPNDGWYDPAVVPVDVEYIVANVSGINEVVVFTDAEIDALAQWAEDNMNDGEPDIIWLPGVTPSTLYPNPNVEPDGSVAERWLESGNIFINVADWFSYTTYETGSRGADNGAAGAENILDLPGIIAFGDNTQITITDAGKQYLPSLGDTMITDRPVVRDAVVAPWEVAEVFGQNADGTMYDPVALRDTSSGGILALLNQANLSHAVDRGVLTVEFINNWLAAQGITTAVEPAGKLTTTWGALKK